MASVKDLVTDAQVKAMHSVVESAAGKFVCFSRLATDDIWVLGATDGCDVWRQDLDLEELDAQRDLAEVGSLDAFLAKLRSVQTLVPVICKSTRKMKNKYALSA